MAHSLWAALRNDTALSPSVCPSRLRLGRKEGRSYRKFNRSEIVFVAPVHVIDSMVFAPRRRLLVFILSFYVFATVVAEKLRDTHTDFE